MREHVERLLSLVLSSPPLAIARSLKNYLEERLCAVLFDLHTGKGQESASHIGCCVFYRGVAEQYFTQLASRRAVKNELFSLRGFAFAVVIQW